MFVKVCGLSTPEDARVASAAGADAVGAVMYPPSPRHVDPETARAVFAAADCGVETVLVVMDMPAVEAARMALDVGASVLQLHGKYTREDFAAAREIFPRLWRATSLRHDAHPVTGDYGDEALLLDAPRAGGGETWDLSALAAVRPEGQWLLAGGLDAENVVDAVAVARPWGVDVSSGVESTRGVKDHQKIRDFVAAARAAERAIPAP